MWTEVDHHRGKRYKPEALSALSFLANSSDTACPAKLMFTHSDSLIHEVRVLISSNLPLVTDLHQVPNKLPTT